MLAALLPLLLGAATATTASRSLDLNVGGTVFKIEPWGHSSLRVRASTSGPVTNLTGRGALLEPGADNKGHPLRVSSDDTGGVAVDLPRRTITNGGISATVSAAGLVTVTRSSDGKVILTETYRGAGPPPTPPPPPTGFFTFAVNNSAAGCTGGISHNACCLDLSNWNRADDASVGISNCHVPGEFKKGAANQHWKPTPVTAVTAVTTSTASTAKTVASGNRGGGGTVQLVVELDGKCLTNHTDDGYITVATCVASAAGQHWTIDATSIKHSSGACLSIAGRNGAVDGGRLSLVSCDATSKLQEWTVAVPGSKPPAPPVPPTPGPADTESTVTFATTPDEVLFGFGEHQQGKLMVKGQNFNMEQCLDYGHSHGGEVCLPWIIGATEGEEEGER
jgi:hypothetical protein